MTNPHRTAEAAIITVFNQKGGIGKTTTSVNLATCLAAAGFTVTLLDVDSQSNAATSLGVMPSGTRGSYHLLKGEATLADVAEPTIFPGLSVCRADDELAGIDIELAADPQPQMALRRSLGRGNIGADVVIIDCPPALGLLPVNALAASHLVLMPVMPEPMAHDGLQMAWRHIHRIQAGLNPDLELAGVIMTLVRDDPVHDALATVLRREFGDNALPMGIPLDARALEASHNDLPVCVFDPDCPSALAYLALAEVIAGQILRLAHRQGNDGADAARTLPAQPSFDAAQTAAVLRDWHEAAMLTAPPPPPSPPPGWLTPDAVAQSLDSAMVRTAPSPLTGPVPRLAAALLGLLAGAVFGFNLTILAHLLGWV